jgi:hypothetical protein
MNCSDPRRGAPGNHKRPGRDRAAAGRSFYGNTKEDAYMCEADAKAAGNRPAREEKHP